MKKTLKNLTIAYYSVYVAAILSALAGIYILKSGYKIDALSQTGISISSTLIILIIGSVPATLAGFHYYTKKLLLIENQDEKLLKYQKASYIRIAILGLALVLGVLFFYIMNSQSMLFSAGIAAIGLFFSKPAEVKIVSELQLEENEETK